MQTLDHPLEQEETQEATPLLERPLFGVIHLQWEVVVYLLLMLVAAGLRFWDLGSRAQHHDESLHAVYSYYLYAGRGYIHDPLMHGPFQFHAIALIYLLFGDSDYTSRILPALLGTVCVGLPYFLRGYLGRSGALLAAVFIAFSPSLFYYSRFVRNDIYIACWNLLLAIGVWRYMETGQRKYALLTAAALALGFTTKETTYLTVVTFGSYLLLTSLREVLPRIARFDFRTVSTRTGIMILVGTLALPQAAAAMDVLWGANANLPGLLGLQGDFTGVGLSPLGGMVTGLTGLWSNLWGLNLVAPTPSLIGKVAAGGFVVVLLLAASAVIGWRWNWALWKQVALMFYAPFILLYTTFFTNIAGFGSGIWGSLEYWMEQHSVQRGAQPWYYYVMLLCVYEFLPLALSIAGWIYYARKRRAPEAQPVGASPLAGEFTWFLLWWFATSLVLYSLAGEKMPWLNVHMALPLLLMAGKALGVFVERMPWRSYVQHGGLYFAVLVAVMPFALRALVSSAGGLDPNLTQLTDVLQAVAAMAALAFLGGTAWQLGRRLQLSGSLVGVAVVALVAAGVMTLRAGWQLVYAHGDIPVEMLVYTQTSPEIPRVLRNIERISTQSGQREDMPITVDSAEGFTWPWAWSLRHYRNVDYPDLTNTTAEPRGVVALLNTNNQASVLNAADKYESPVRIPHRWWFNEVYDFGIPRKDLQFPNVESLTAIWKDLTSLDHWKSKWSYFYNRDIPAKLGSSDALVYYPKGAGLGSYAPSTGQARPAPPVEGPPSVPLAADLQLGGASATGGGMLSPRGVAVDVRGNVYVIDSRRNRLFKLDPAGTVVARVGDSGSADGQFNEPWGVAVDSVGNVYVADTWNHRVQKFDQNLRFVTKWGAFGEVPGGGERNPGVFYGPRSVAVDKDDNVYVTDTGNKRVQKFSPEGRPLAVFGTPGKEKGQFAEPVGIAVTPGGEFLVADTWNRRVQRFNASFQYVGEFPVIGWVGNALLNKPYLAGDAEGTIWLTDPETHRILHYSGTGVLLNVYGKFGSDLSSLNTPVGITTDALGRIYVGDGGNSRVLRFPPPR